MKNVQTLQHLLTMVIKLRNLIPQMNKRNKRQSLEENLLVVKLLLQLKKRIHKNRNNLQRGLRKLKLKQQDRQKQKLKQQDRHKQKLKQQVPLNRQQQRPYQGKRLKPQLLKDLRMLLLLNLHKLNKVKNLLKITVW